MRLMRVALQLADRNVWVAPCWPRSKMPAVKWREWSTTDRAKIEAKWRESPYNVLIDCEKSGLLVVDLDTKNGIDGIGNWERWAADIPPTMTVRTPSGGEHRYYRGAGRNSASLLAPGVDTRGRGGYVIAPGSVLPNGIYEYVSGKIQPAPEALISALQPPEIERVAWTGEVNSEGAYGFVRRHMAEAVNGTRNRSLFDAARWLAKFTELDEAERRAVLLKAGTAAGLSERESLATIQSAFKAVQPLGL